MDGTFYGVFAIEKNRQFDSLSLVLLCLAWNGTSAIASICIADINGINLACRYRHFHVKVMREVLHKFRNRVWRFDNAAAGDKLADDSIRIIRSQIAVRERERRVGGFVILFDFVRIPESTRFIPWLWLPLFHAFKGTNRSAVLPAFPRFTRGIKEPKRKNFNTRTDATAEKQSMSRRRMRFRIGCWNKNFISRTGIPSQRYNAPINFPGTLPFNEVGPGQRNLEMRRTKCPVGGQLLRSIPVKEVLHLYKPRFYFWHASLCFRLHIVPFTWRGSVASLHVLCIRFPGFDHLFLIVNRHLIARFRAICFAIGHRSLRRRRKRFE